MLIRRGPPITTPAPFGPDIWRGEFCLMDENRDPPRPRPFVGVLMKCCRTYVRAYLNGAGDAFVGWCPRCAAAIRIEAVDEGGTTDRFFEAS
jgi:hypothetical protein